MDFGDLGFIDLQIVGQKIRLKKKHGQTEKRLSSKK
jgi:hypothetical protein